LNLQPSEESFEEKTQNSLYFSEEDFLGLLSLLENQYKNQKPLNEGLSKLKVSGSLFEIQIK